MKLAAVLWLAASLFACASAGAAPDVPRASGWELGAWRWSWQPDREVEGGRQDYDILSVGRWRRLTRAVTWQTRLEYADLAGWKGDLFESHAWSEKGRSVVLRTGLALHPPVTAGLAPYVGASVGLGYVHPGDDHQAWERYPGWEVTTERHHPGPGVSLGIEAGLRLFTRPGWPTVCATAGLNALIGTGGSGGTTEPLIWIGY